MTTSLGSTIRKDQIRQQVCLSLSLSSDVIEVAVGAFSHWRVPEPEK